MPELTSPPVLSTVVTANSRLSELPLKEGQLIFVQDKNTIAFDYGGKRRLYKQIEELSTESSRTSILAPVTGQYYFVVETGVMWTYQDGWVQITSAPKDITDYADNAASTAAADAKAYADELGKRVTGDIDEDGNLIIMFDDKVWSNE